MNMEKEVYDIVVSLGGSCAIQDQMKRRGLRRFSLPFDWIGHGDDDAVRWMAESLKTGFKDFFLYDNLLQTEDPANLDKFKYRYYDTASGTITIHEFNDVKESPGEYDRVMKVINRRMRRLFRTLDRCHSALLIINTCFDLKTDTLKMLKSSFEARFPQAKFKLIALRFRPDFNDTDMTMKTIDDGIELLTSDRGFNDYDFYQTNYEWSFLDNVRLSNIDLSLGRSDKVKFILKKTWRLLKTAVKAVLPYCIAVKIS